MRCVTALLCAEVVPPAGGVPASVRHISDAAHVSGLPADVAFGYYFTLLVDSEDVGDSAVVDVQVVDPDGRVIGEFSDRHVWPEPRGVGRENRAVVARNVTVTFRTAGPHAVRLLLDGHEFASRELAITHAG